MPSALRTLLIKKNCQAYLYGENHGLSSAMWQMIPVLSAKVPKKNNLYEFFLASNFSQNAIGLDIHSLS